MLSRYGGISKHLDEAPEGEPFQPHGASRWIVTSGGHRACSVYIMSCSMDVFMYVLFARLACSALVPFSNMTLMPRGSQASPDPRSKYRAAFTNFSISDIEVFLYQVKTQWRVPVKQHPDSCRMPSHVSVMSLLCVY